METYTVHRKQNEASRVNIQDFSTLIWREREQLRLLLFKLEEEYLLLSAGKERWRDYAAREVEQVLERLRSAALLRTVEAAAVAVDWGVREEATLSALAEAAPPGPWGELLASHLAEMQSLSGEIVVAERSVRSLQADHVRRTPISERFDVDAGTY